MQISNRIAVALVLAMVTGASVLALGGYVLLQFSQVQRERAEQVLVWELESRRQRVQTFLEDVAKDLQLFSTAQATRRGLIEFKGAFEQLDQSAESSLQRKYIDDNPHPVGRKQGLHRAKEGGHYDEVHERYHDLFLKLATARGYYDVFLVTSSGDIVYTVFKERDFATNLLYGKYKDTQLGQVFKRVHDDPRPERIEYRDFERYAPSDDAPSTFLGAAVFDDGRFAGALMVQLLAERFDELMRFDVALGESGETYLVGPDLLMRTRSRFEETSSVLRIEVDTPSVRGALEGRSGLHLVDDYRGVEVYSAYAPLVWQGVSWAAIAEIDKAEVDAPVRAIRWQAVGIGVACAIFAFVVGLLLAERRPVKASGPEAAGDG